MSNFVNSETNKIKFGDEFVEIRQSVSYAEVQELNDARKTLNESDLGLKLMELSLASRLSWTREPSYS